MWRSSGGMAERQTLNRVEVSCFKSAVDVQDLPVRRRCSLARVPWWIHIRVGVQLTCPTSVWLLCAVLARS